MRRENGVAKKRDGDLGEKLDRRLAAYVSAAGAAGVGALALAIPAKAQIVYTPAHVNFGAYSTTYIDINNDGTNDFEITDAYCRGYCSGGYGWQDNIKMYGLAVGNGAEGKKGQFVNRLSSGPKLVRHRSSTLTRWKQSLMASMRRTFSSRVHGRRDSKVREGLWACGLYSRMGFISDGPQ